MRAPCMIERPTPPQPNTATVCPACSPGRAQRRANTRQHAAADQRRTVQRQVGVDAHQRVLVQQHVLRIATRSRRTPGTVRRAAKPAARPSRRARRGRRCRHSDGPTEALRAGAAEAGQAGDDMVADAHAGHVVADRLDHAGAFMAQHHRPVEWEPPEAVDDVQVGMADAGGDGAHQHLAAPGLVEIDSFDRQRSCTLRNTAALLCICHPSHDCRHYRRHATMPQTARRSRRIDSLKHGH